MSFDLDAISIALNAPKLDLGPAPKLSAEQKQVLADAKATRANRGKGDIVNRALAAVDAENNLEGARLAMEAVKQFPDSMPDYLAGAVALDRLGYLAEALNFFGEALKLSPENPTICGLLGGTAERAKQLELSVKFYRKAIQLAPDDAGHVCNLAGVLRTPQIRQNAALCLGASEQQIFRLIVLPSAIPEQVPSPAVPAPPEPGLAASCTAGPRASAARQTIGQPGRNAGRPGHGGSPPARPARPGPLRW